MELCEIFNTFRERVVELELFRTVVKETTRQELTRYAELARAEADHARDDLLHYRSSESMGFYDPESGVYTRYGATESRAEDRIQQIVKQKNRQYGWLLVEAYEEFEDFLERTYAWLGKHDWRAWRLAEFGNILHAELSCQPFSWYLEAVKRKFAQDPKAILARLRSIYPGLAASEACAKPMDRNLRLHVELIANLRHKIVHARGTISDRERLRRTGAHQVWTVEQRPTKGGTSCGSGNLPVAGCRRLLRQPDRGQCSTTAWGPARGPTYAESPFRHLWMAHLGPHSRCRSDQSQREFPPGFCAVAR